VSLPGRHVAQHQNGDIYAGFAQGDGFAQRGNPHPTAAVVQNSARYFYHAVPVGIGFENGHNFGRADHFGQLPHIIGNGIQINFHPGGAGRLNGAYLFPPGPLALLISSDHGGGYPAAVQHAFHAGQPAPL
jgi:hypothetical protein